MSPSKLNTLKQNMGHFIDEKWNGLFQGNLLRVTCFAGLILSLLIGGSLGAAYFLGPSSGAEAGERDNSFYRLLRDYDRSAGITESAKRDRELDKLEKKAEGVESWLSVLKRRRELARLNSQYAPAFRQSVRRARQAYPYSEPLAAVAAAALIQNAAVTRETEAELRDCLSLFADPRFDSLSLSLHALLGDLKNPLTALEHLPPAMSAANAAGFFPASEKEAIAADLAILKLLRGDSAGAAAEIQGLAAGTASTGTFLRFAAEYFYDFGDILRSAELFSLLPDEEALLRQADALWLAGYAGSARTIWSMAPTPRALYNLALTAENPEEAAALLKRLAGLAPDALSEPGGLYGLIRCSRLLDAAGAVALLETGGAGNFLIDLEILKRRTELRETGRLVAETWLLLGRYPEEENLYRWGAWFFDLQRQYNETAVLLKTAARHQFAGEWAGLHEALQLIREGNLDRAESILAAVPAETASWAAAANLGRVLEARRAPARALEQYELAVAAVPDRQTNSQIQLRIARCLKILNRAEESRRVLEYALELNPDNLSARLELERLGL
jgi:tetratricopeptide (TPR) repeat protein